MRILVIEDDPTTGDYIARGLREAGPVVDLSRNGREGLIAAQTSDHDVLVVDRATARSTKRSLFGMALPRIKLFGDNDDEEIEQIESSIASAYDAKDGLSVFVLADGARWKQTEGRYTFPKAGQPIVIRRAALGSFFAKVDNQAAVRVIRLPQGQ